MLLTQYFLHTASVPEHELHYQSRKLNSLKYNTYIKLDPYVNDVKGYYPYINELVNDVLKFKSCHIEKAKGIFNSMNPDQRTMVSIHVRLTDMDGHLKKLWNLENALDEYYGRAMLHFQNNYEVKIIEIFRL